MYRETRLNEEEFTKYGYIDGRRLGDFSCMCNLGDIYSVHKATAYLQGIIKARIEKAKKSSRRFMSDKAIKKFIQERDFKWKLENGVRQ